MIKAFVTNLEKDKNRRIYMENMLTQYGIKHEILTGLYGKEAGQEFIDQIYDKEQAIAKNGQELSRSEIGCAYSHLQIYKKIVEENLPYALVLEDDVELNTRIVDILEIINEGKFKDETKHNGKKYAKNNIDFDWLQIDYVEPGMFFFMHWIDLSLKLLQNLFSQKKYIKFVIHLVYILLIKLPYVAIMSLYEGLRDSYYWVRGKGAIVNFWRPLYLASAYIISNRGARLLIELNSPIFLTADRLPNYARLKGLKYKVYAPLISRQLRKVFESNIANNGEVLDTSPRDKWEARLQFLAKSIRYVLRHIWTRPVYLWNYMINYPKNNYAEKIKFYDFEQTQNILKNKSLIRLGDGEIHMHNGGDIACYQRYDRRLRDYIHNIIVNYNDKSNYVLGVPQFALESNSVLKKKGLISCWMPLKATVKTYFNKEAHYADAHIFYREGGFDKILRPILESHKIIMITGAHNVKMLESAKVNIHQKLNIKFISTREVESFRDFDHTLGQVYNYIQELKYTSIEDFNRDYRIVVSSGPGGKPIAYELSQKGYIAYDIGKGVETMYQENNVHNMIG